MFRLLPFRKKHTDTDKYEEYKEYMSQEEGDGCIWITLKAQGWTRLIHEMLDERIKRDFELSPVKERCWANEYDSGRRKVISLFLVNDMCATIKWGWNFEYIPMITGSRCVWVRTDKSINTNTFRLSEEFVNGGEEGKQRKSVFGRFSFNKPEDFNKIIDEIDTAYNFVRKDIEDYFNKTSSYDGMLSELEEICGNSYYCFLHPQNYLVKIGVENYMGITEKAMKQLKESEYPNEELKADFGKKIGLPL